MECWPLPTCPFFPVSQGQSLSIFIPFPGPCIEIKGPLPHWLMYQKVRHLCQQLDDANHSSHSLKRLMPQQVRNEKAVCQHLCMHPPCTCGSLKFKEEETICPICSLHPALPEVLTGGCLTELYPTCLYLLELLAVQKYFLTAILSFSQANLVAPPSTTLFQLILLSAYFLFAFCKFLKHC